MRDNMMTLNVFEFTPVNGNTIEKTWLEVKTEYPDAVFKQVIVKDDYRVGMLLAFI